MSKVAILLSGGVDSACAAYILKKRGHDLAAVHLKMHTCPRKEEINPSSCGGLQQERDARKTAETLAIPFYLFNLEKEFKRTVLGNFFAEYAGGRTPNPCIVCNGYVRFPIVWERLKKTGFNFMATGHYARILQNEKGYHLYRGTDKARDQSYFLYRLPAHLLPRVLFPLGELTKERTREIARKQSLPVAEKKSSQDFCFLQEDYRDYLKDQIEARPGEIRDSLGRKIGTHNGIHNFTVGQRKGLGSFSKPVYVIAISAADNSVVIGSREEASKSEIQIDRMILSEPEKKGFKAAAKIRYSHRGEECSVAIDGLTARVTFSNPVLSPTPGQSVVFYDGEKVLGGGIITDDKGKR